MRIPLTSPWAIADAALQWTGLITIAVTLFIFDEDMLAFLLLLGWIGALVALRTIKHRNDPSGA